ncbi:helix-turn-helix transcriptional regulator [Maribacter arcticus]|uniref:helix-turn-helix transcriptional regulator n=1 Tax=Maribacter arcticus TaxID=561365 RepID=UPI0030031AFA
MKEIINNSSSSLNSYIENNRTKIDESLVSLRLMKEVDDFLDVNEISQRDFADNIGYSEAFVSQLMSGTKKFNASFINRFEKVYDIKIDFKIKSKSTYDFISKISNAPIEININILGLTDSENIYSLDNRVTEFSEFHSGYLTLEG